MLAAGTTGLVIRHPTLWLPAWRTLRVFWPSTWRGWHRYAAFRLETMYGPDLSSARPEQLVSYMLMTDQFRRTHMGRARPHGPLTEEWLRRNL